MENFVFEEPFTGCVICHPMSHLIVQNYSVAGQIYQIAADLGTESKLRCQGHTLGPFMYSQAKDILEL